MEEFMAEAIRYAKETYDRGNFPVGAVLVIDDKIVDGIGNSIRGSGNWCSHAESLLIRKNGELIRDRIKNHDSDVAIYSTLEPCLMCLGTIVLNRIPSIVYACPDPYGGACDMRADREYYDKHWPNITKGVMARESYDMLVEFMRKQEKGSWRSLLERFLSLEI